MIRLRFVALVGGFALLLAGYATYVTFLRAAPPFEGATDPAHVAAVTALIAELPAPAGTTVDPYETWCGGSAAACWTSTTQQPKTLASPLTRLLVAKRAKVRSHECDKPESRPIQAPEGACVAVLDYHGSRLDVIASSRGKSDNGGRNFLAIYSPRVNPIGSSNLSAPLGAWATVNPLPVAWTTGVTCTRPAKGGCIGYGRSAGKSPVIALPLAQVCAGVRAAMRGQFFFDIDEDKPAAISGQRYCQIVSHRYRSLGGKDGELVISRATSVDATSTTLSFSVSSG